MTNLALLSAPEVRVARLPGEIAVISLLGESFISLLGEHDLATAWEVRNAITFALEQGTHVVVDLSETEFIDSSIIHVLSESEQLAQEHGLRVSVQLQQTPAPEGRLKSQGCSTYCLSTEPAPRRPTRSGSRVA
jgi:anti-anti-sigma factor